MSNAYEFSVSELAFSLKRAIEDQFGNVRVRGELGRVTIAKSGHCYLDIKDDRAVINSIIWKGVMNRLSMRPEEGMEVVVEGKLSTYPGRSNYQLIVEKMELAGAGALMALFEKRKKAYAAEGLFDEARKVDLPFMPKTIGVVTSPTGAVIRDILHRIMDRFPVHVIVWPVLVQGDRAAEQISAAITGFNHAEGFPRPDVLIVARGGGTLEDLWCFNEDNVVRAAAASNIPLISAIGHETDWTLIDYVVDYRAPTPTGAAEVAVPVRADWLTTIKDYGVRLTRGLNRSVSERENRLRAARLPRLENVLASPRQRLDLATAKMPGAGKLLEPMRQALGLISAKMPAPARILEPKAQRLTYVVSRLPDGQRLTQLPAQNLSAISSRLRPTLLDVPVKQAGDRLDALSRRAEPAISRKLDQYEARLTRAAGLLEAYSYQGVLARGYALVTDADGKVIRSKDTANSGDEVTLTFADGERRAVVDGDSQTIAAKPKAKSKRPTPKPSFGQGDLF